MCTIRARVIVSFCGPVFLDPNQEYLEGWPAKRLLVAWTILPRACVLWAISFAQYLLDVSTEANLDKMTEVARLHPRRFEDSPVYLLQKLSCSLSECQALAT